MTAYGGIEAGGSKWECAVGTGPDDLRATETVRTTTPQETLGRVVAFFEREDGRGDRCRLVRPRRPQADVPHLGTHHDDAEAGLGADGRRPGDPPPAFGTGRLRHRRQRGRGRRAALGRRPGDSTPSVTSRWGRESVAARWSAEPSCTASPTPSSATCASPHDRDADPFPGVCPYHGDCWEGLASGRAGRGRAGDDRRRSSTTTPFGETPGGIPRCSVSSASSPSSHRSES